MNIIILLMVLYFLSIFGMHITENIIVYDTCMAVNILSVAIISSEALIRRCYDGTKNKNN